MLNPQEYNLTHEKSLRHVDFSQVIHIFFT